jgi:hypothetical protein
LTERAMRAGMLGTGAVVAAQYQAIQCVDND